MCKFVIVNGDDHIVRHLGISCVIQMDPHHDFNVWLDLSEMLDCVKNKPVFNIADFDLDVKV